MRKSERFALVLSPAEKAALQRLAKQERLPAAAVVRRLIWHAAERLNHFQECAGQAREVADDE